MIIRIVQNPLVWSSHTDENHTMRVMQIFRRYERPPTMIPEFTNETKLKDPTQSHALIDSPTNIDYRRWRNAVSECLVDADMDELAERWDKCSCGHATVNITNNAPVLPDKTNCVVVCSDNPQHRQKAIFPTCHLRICPDCARRAAARLTAKLLPVMQKCASRNSKSMQLRKIVLTTDIDLEHPQAKQHIVKYLNLIAKMFEEFWGKSWRKKAGIAVFTEFGAEGRKLHFHIIVFGRFIAQDDLSAKWFELTGNRVVWIARIDTENVDGELKEAIKYATKFWSKDREGNIKYIPPELIPTLVKVLEGTRRIRTFGIFYNVPPIETKPVCADCGADCKVIWPDDWQLYIETGWSGLEFRKELHLKPGNKSVFGNDPPDGNQLFYTGSKQPMVTKQQVLSQAFNPQGIVRDYTEWTPDKRSR